VAFALAVSVAVTVRDVRGKGPLLRPSGLEQIGEFFASALHPALGGAFLAVTGRAMLTTLAYAVLATALSVVIGLTAGVLASETWWRMGDRQLHLRGRGRVSWWTARILLVVPRGIHEVVWGLFLLSIFGIEPIVAVLAIAIPFGAITAKVFAEILDDTDRGPAELMLAAGASRATTFVYAVLPSALSGLVSYGFYRLDCAIRSATILGLVGAGGLGFELQLSFSTLRYAEIWTLLYALVVLTLLAEAWGSAVRSRLAARSDRPRNSRDAVLVGSLIAGMIALPVCAVGIGLDLGPLVDGRSWSLAGELLRASFPPTLGAGTSGPGGSGAGGVWGLLELSVDTLVISVLAILLAFGGGLLLAGVAARPAGPQRRGLLARRLLAAGTRLLLVTLRAIPPPIWALVALFVVLPGILPGALALGIYTAGVLGRLMAEGVENLDRRPLEALRTLGASGAQVYAYGVLPAAAPRFAGYGCYRWEVTIRDTVVVGVVGAGGLGMLLQTQLALFDYGGAVTTIGSLLALTALVDLLSTRLRRGLA